MKCLFKLLFSSSWVRAFWLWHNEKSTHIFRDLCIAKTQASMLADAVLRHPPLSSRLLPLPTKLCPQGDIPLSPPSFSKAEPVMVLAHDYMCNFPILPTRQRDRSSLRLTPRRSNTCTRYTVQMCLSKATTSVWHSNAASVAARWVHLSQLTDPHLALGQLGIICFYNVFCLNKNLPTLLLQKKRFTNSHARVLSSKEIPSEATVSTPLLSLHWHQVSTLPSMHGAADVWQTTLHNLLDQG